MLHCAVSEVKSTWLPLHFVQLNQLRYFHHMNYFDKLRCRTWQHLHSKYLWLFNYILVRQRDLCDVLHIKVMPSADCDTDQKFLRTKVRLNIKPLVRKRGTQVKKSDTYRKLSLK